MLPGLLLLHQARLDKAALEAELATVREALYATQEFVAVRELEAAIAEKDAQQKAARMSISQYALNEYSEHANKHPAPGIEIRVSRKVIFDPAQAVPWCQQNLMSALVLDPKVFSRIMLQLEKANGLAVPGFVKIEDEPTVTIATDLSKYVEPGVGTAEARDEM